MKRSDGMFPAGSVIWLFSRVVPAFRREDWVAEWRSELEYALAESLHTRRSGWRVRLQLVARSLGSLADALSLRRLHGGSGRWRWSARDGLRTIRRQPLFSLSVIATLAVGMGSATAIFSVVDGLMLKPLPFREPDGLVSLFARDVGPYLDAGLMAEWKAQTQVFTEVRAHSGRSVVLSGAGEPLQLRAALLEPGFLRMLGLSPLRGRDFLTEEGQPGRDRVVLLSEELWRGAFGADPGIVGQVVRFDGEPHTVIGVLPRQLRVLPGGVVSVAMPFTSAAGESGAYALARLRPGLDRGAAQAVADRIAKRMETEEPRENGWAVDLVALQRMLGEQVRSGLVAISGAVVLVMLIACVNAAGLLLVRGLARQQELALRAALGGSRATIFQHVLIESLLLALLSGVAATLFAWALLRALLALVPETLIRFGYNTIGIDGRVLGFALVLTVVTGALFGIAPALRASRANVARAGRSGTATAAHVRVRSVLQVLQLAFAVMLLTGAALLGRSFMRLMAIDPGYDFDRLLLLTYSSTSQQRAEPGATAAFRAELDARLRALPGVEGVSWSSGSGFFVGYTIETEDGDPRESGDELLPHASVDTSYFRVMGIPILRGRGFQASDLLAEANTAVIDIDLANSLWPGQEAVGRRFRIRENPWLTVVGVSADVKLDGPNDPYGRWFIFYPRSPDRVTGGTVSIRTTGRPATLARAVHDIVLDLDPGQPFQLVTGEESRSQSVAQQRFLLLIMVAFANIALLLAGVGIYGLVAFVVGQRTREIGVRMAIGARSGRVMAEVLGSGLRLAIGGSTIGVTGAVLLARLIEKLLFGVAPLDPIALATSVLLLLLCCAAALIVPAHRAASVSPSVALRAE